MVDQTADEIKKANIAKMGEELGAQFSELRQELIRAHVQWTEFLELFGTKKETVDLLNRAAPFHFRLGQDARWKSIILTIARLVDPPKSASRSNLTVNNLPELLTDAGLKSRIKDFVKTAEKACEFCREWRHQIFAHNDLALALNRSAKTVPTAEKQQIDTALRALADVLNTVEAHFYEGAQTAYSHTIYHNGASTLISVLSDGVKAREDEIDRLQSNLRSIVAAPQTGGGSKKETKRSKLKARLPRGLADRGPAEIAATRHMVEAIRVVFERYGFEPVETPAIEYTDALGKFLPDQDRPNEGVFSFQDDDEQWLSLRYDLTAPLARYVAENFQQLALPYRSYRYGWAFRNEKPGPGRFRQFMQFDADTVGAASMAADAEMCMLAADTMEALGIPRGSYVVKVWSRKLLEGVLDAAHVIDGRQRLTALRAIDKLDRLGMRGVQQLLGPGRKDESGDFTKGVGLPNSANNFITTSSSTASSPTIFSSYSSEELLAPTIIDTIEKSEKPPFSFHEYMKKLTAYLGDKPLPDSAESGLKDLQEIDQLIQASGYAERIKIDPSVVRGLEYYTGPVFEVDLTFAINDDKGRPVRFGSVGGGGRYDGLVSRFMGQPVPATGFSIGVSRLQAALTALGKISSKPDPGPVVVTVFGAESVPASQKLAADLRNAGIRAELYLGNPKHSIGQQLKYADKRGSPCAVIQGPDEKAKGVVQVRDLVAGSAPSDLADREAYLKMQAAAQVAVKEAELVEAVRKLLARRIR